MEDVKRKFVGLVGFLLLVFLGYTEYKYLQDHQNGNGWGTIKHPSESGVPKVIKGSSTQDRYDDIGLYLWCQSLTCFHM